MNPAFIPPQYIASARFGAFTPYIPSYIALVNREGYQPPTIIAHLRLIGRLHRWLRRTGHALRELDDLLLERFLQCQRRKRRTRASGDRVTLQRLLAVLRDAGVIAFAKKSSVPATSAQGLADQYRRFLLHERGLAESTVDNYVWHVAQFLAEQFDRGAVRPDRLQAHDAVTFIRRTARRHSTPHAKHLVAALRAFFRFLHYQGKIKSDLAPALPTVADWALSTLPKYTSPDSIQKVLDRCDQRTSVGRRDYAVLLLLARLGLRGGEVLRLELGDIDWRNAQITIRAKKGPAGRVYPCPLKLEERSRDICARIGHAV